MKNYVKEYKEHKEHKGHKVPSDATHYGGEGGLYADCFYKKGFYRRPQQNYWFRTDCIIPSHAVELLEN